MGHVADVRGSCCPWRVERGPGSASTARLKHKADPNDVITAAHKRSLWVTLMKDSLLRRQYKVLLSDLPDNVHVKLGAQRLETEEGISHAITNLVNLHSGRSWSWALYAHIGSGAVKRQALPALAGRTSSGTDARTASPSATAPMAQASTSTVWPKAPAVQRT